MTMELWDIYDSKKQRTGRTMKRNDWTMKEGDYHLTVLGVLMRPDGKFLITKRVETKAWAPGWWEVSGGAAMAGEDSREAVNRFVVDFKEEDVHLQEAEAAGFMIADREKIEELAAEGIFLHYDSMKRVFQ